MGGSVSRRDFILGVLALPFVPFASSDAGEAGEVSVAAARLKRLEAASGGRLGVAVLHGASTIVTYRGNERFPLCSTWKLIAVAAVLKRSESESGLMQKNIVYSQSDLVTYSPITKLHVATGMTVAELCVAALDVSDNTAGNLLMKLVGGPEAVTSFARAAGDPHFRLDRWEPDLNRAIPGDPSDTTTPIAMAGSVKRLALGPILAHPQRNELCEWMLSNRIGNDRMRAGAPAGWRIGDKTGSGEYGTTNDVGVIWPSSGSPYVLALYYTHGKKDASPRSDVLREATRIVFDGLSSVSSEQ